MTRSASRPRPSPSAMTMATLWSAALWSAALSGALALIVHAAPGSSTKPAPGSTTKPAPGSTARPVVAGASFNQPLSPDQKIVHALNRLGFGPRPGDVESVRAMGLERWIARQMEPEKIDDAAVEAKLSRLSLLRLSSAQLARAYASDQLFQRMQAMQRRQRGAATTPDGAMTPDGGAMAGGAMMPDGGVMERPQSMTLNPQQRQVLEAARREGFERGVSIQALGELATARLLRACESNRQLHEVLVDFWSNHFNVDVKKGPVRTMKLADERDVIRPHVWGRFRDLLGASAKSPAMLVYLDNARSTRTYEMPQRFAGPGARRNRMRRGAAQNGALQNGAPPNGAPPNGAAMPDAAMPGGEMPAGAMPDEATPPRTRGGLNENYARELMELHTLGVNGGYTQKDVQEVARCLTGWSVNRETGEFQFKRFAHDDGEKIVLGQTIPAGGGIRDGERVLDILAKHPSTARFLARKLCVRLVADEPPPALVERAAKTFLQSDGDLHAVTRTIVTAPEFFSTAAYRAKVKSPFEFAVSAVRALGGVLAIGDASLPRGRLMLIANGAASMNPNGGRGRYANRAQKTLAREIAGMGQPLFSYQAPTGYPENSASWVSAGALVARLNFALDLTGGTLADVRVKPSDLVEGMIGDNQDAALNRLVSQLVAGGISAATRATLQKQMAPNTPVDPIRLSALLLGSPEFQRR